MRLPLRTSVWPSLFLLGWAAAAAQSATVNRLDVRIVTGGGDVGAGSSLELRIYEAGKTVRRLALLHGEGWQRNSTHVVPVKLSDPLDPRSVVRFSLYYQGTGPAASEGLEIVAADVEVPTANGAPELLLDATLSGVIPRHGELASTERDPAALTCKSDADCDDHRSCNGIERCSPRSAGADARGCVKGKPVACPVNQVCTEGVGCRGVAGGSNPDEH